MIRTIAIILLFLTSIYFYSTTKNIEGFTSSSSCYDILIKKGNLFYLYNKKKAYVPGVNPVKFNNLEEYVEFIKWQRSKGTRCPVLYYQQTFDPQNNKRFSYITNPLKANTHLFNSSSFSPTLTSKLVDAGRSKLKKFNKNLYPGFDPENQYIGTYTPLDKMFHEKQAVSDNPMDPNWGGVRFTKKAIKSGKYYENK